MRDPRPEQPAPKPKDAPSKQARAAEALRANLLKRKAQAKARSDGPAKAR
jgi:hypothetical protein